jgi:hypothetical protein
LHGDELTGDFRNEPETISLSGLDLLCLLAGKLHQTFSDFCNTIGPKLIFSSGNEMSALRGTEETFTRRELFRDWTQSGPP